MASRIQAVSEYGPKLVSSGLLTAEFVSQHIESRTSLNAGTVKGVLMEVGDTVKFFTPLSMGVVVDGLGIVRPWMQRNGSLKLHMRFNSALEAAVNAAFRADRVRNKANLGLPMEALIAMWNRDHPDDPILD